MATAVRKSLAGLHLRIFSNSDCASAMTCVPDKPPGPCAPEDQAAKHASIKPTIVVGAVEGDKVTVGTPEKQFTFPYNKETEHNFLVDRPAWTTVIPHDDGFTFKTKFTPDGSASEEKVWKFTDSGIVSTSTNHKGVKTVAHYKRV